MKFLCLLLVLFLTSANLVVAADTRGLRVVAKDPSTGQSAEVSLYNKSYAVVIGIDQYQNLPPDRQLKNAVRDAQGVADVLKRNFRFDRIFSLYNRDATKERILELLTEELPKNVGSDDSVFIFWAGHGNQEESAEGDIGYLIPYDGSTVKIQRNITMSEIRDTVSKKIPAKHIFYVMDACYSGLLTTRAVDSNTRRDLKYLQAITNERVRQVLTAGGKGEEVLDGGSKGHSVFTGRLIEALESAGDFITANEIQAILKERVYGDAIGRGKAQTPGFGALSGSGDFVFVPSKEYQLAEKQAVVDRIGRQAEQTRQENEKLKKQMADDEAILAAAIKAGDEIKRLATELDLKKKQGLQRLEEEKLREQQAQQRRVEEETAELKQREAERTRIQEEARTQQLKFQEAEQRRAQEQAWQEQEFRRQKVEEEKRNAELRALGEAKRKKALEAAQAALSIEAAVVQIKKADAEIAEVNREFDAERARLRVAADKRLEDRKSRLKGDYDKRMLELKNQPAVSVTKSVIQPRDEEFETLAAYKARVKKAEDEYLQRLADAQLISGKARQSEQELYDTSVIKAEAEHRTEINENEQRITAGRDEAVKPFRERIAAIAAKEYPVSSNSMKLTVGKYDPDSGKFPVSIISTTPLINISVESVLLLASDEAKLFKQHYTNGLVRADITMKTSSSKPVRMVMVDEGVKSDADGYLLELEGGEFITIAERKRRQAHDQLIYTDPTTGLMWARNADIADKTFRWENAVSWINKLNYGGYNDWRFPTLKELKSLAKLGSDKPSEYLNSNGFYNVRTGEYWTSTTFTDDERYPDSYVKTVEMANGKENLKHKIVLWGYNVWPVRDGKLPSR